MRCSAYARPARLISRIVDDLKSVVARPTDVAEAMKYNSELREALKGWMLQRQLADLRMQCRHVDRGRQLDRRLIL
jgi:hypothetical protein